MAWAAYFVFSVVPMLIRIAHWHHKHKYQRYLRKRAKLLGPRWSDLA